ncbi:MULTISPECIES: TerC family protein [Azorhizobium]|uniref:Integral membrane protein n=1 Tax=Azorhizobium caulinodans (strain ATCC 43989 / DSM 5975 / JCM 20966 / LMG 6465 / NBRC 14845 / NCIMB 13405 / ORS 571) TaxID=438753 RepID=A8HS96_AZOC5|nr:MULTISPECIES: TerC family protein [Azorhizobium]TDU00542.1 YjbE family integral membrane protein [Azorhizobium sp. AG788]BAF90155.1 integral membrane protein [Azorhizobium caulinodans ORS 571]
MDLSNPTFWLSLLQIVWIDLLLSGDNAVVIALACRSLPPSQRRWGIILGAGAAVGLRIIFALAISYLLGVPFLKIAGAVLLLWIAAKLVLSGEEEAHEVEASDSLWRAVRTIAIADAVMSLDNVVAIAAASRGHPELFIFGLLLTIPLIVAGSQLVLALLQRLPILVWAGAALLGFIAGEMLVSDVISIDLLKGFNPAFVKPDLEAPGGIGPAALPHYVAGALGAVVVVAIGLVLRKRPAASEHGA